MLSNTLRLNFWHTKIISILHPRYHLTITGHILKNKQNNKHVCNHEIMQLIIMKIKTKMKIVFRGAIFRENGFFMLMSNCNRKSNWYLITRTKSIILFLSEWKRNLLSAVASVNTSRTIDLKQLVQLNPIFSLVLFIVWVENFTLNRKL